jgi:HlyD family type I secretion membrane fusion protein
VSSSSATLPVPAAPPSPSGNAAAERDPVPARALVAGWGKVGLVAIGIWLAGFAGWALWAPISGAVIAQGTVKVERNRLTVTHRDGGIVARILVREGQTVTQGQPLMVLEDARIDATVETLRTQLVAEQLRRSRLEAEAAQRSSWVPEPALARSVADERAREALSRERSAFEARRRTLDGQLATVAGQAGDIEAEIRAHERNNVASADALRLLREEIASNEALLQENFVNRTRVLALRRGVAEYESRIETTSAELAQARQRLSELEGRRASLRLAYVQAATEDLREASARIVDLEDRLRAGQDAAGRQVITAPAAGRLVDLRVNTVGSAVGAREPLVDIVPADQPLVIETRVGADAITEVRAGQQAEVRLLGTRMRNTPLLDGRVARISADALVDARSGLPYFEVQVEVGPPAEGFPPGTALLAGQSTEVYIKTSDRTALEFLAEPLVAGMRRSFREH